MSKKDIGGWCLHKKIIVNAKQVETLANSQKKQEIYVTSNNRNRNDNW
jgi:hypothetical protein